MIGCARVSTDDVQNHRVPRQRLHSPFAFCVGTNILLNTFLSNTNNFCLMFSVKTQHSDPYTTTGLIRALYNFILVFLDLSLLLSIFWFAKKAFPIHTQNGNTCFCEHCCFEIGFRLLKGSSSTVHILTVTFLGHSQN